MIATKSNAEALLGGADVLPQFAAFARDAAERAASLRSGLPFALAIDHERVGDETYRIDLVDEARLWRAGRKTSTVYIPAYRTSMASD